MIPYFQSVNQCIVNIVSITFYNIIIIILHFV